jgi:RNA recognition motif-containing protein
MSAKLFVGNLSNETSSDELRTLFGEVGVVESCQLITDRETGRSKGFGFIEMNSVEAASAAKDKFNGQELHGRALTVNDAKPKHEGRNPAGYSGSRRY